MAKHFSLEVVNNNDHQPIVSGSKVRSIGQLINFLRGCIGGARRGAVTLKFFNDLVAASGTLTLATSSGVVGGVINGVTITDTWATSDTNSAALIAAAINASTNALVLGHVTASSSGAVVTVTAVRKGKVGNTVTLVSSGTNVTASGARLTGGTETAITFSV